MKRVILLFAIAITSLVSSSQNSNELQVSLAGLGGIKLGMTIPEVEKILGQKINTTLTKDTKDYIMDTISVGFKGADMKIIFYNEYTDQQKYQVAVYGITSSSALCKTKSGISIGDDKLKIITTYDTYFMEIAPEHEGAGNGEFKPSKTNSTITLHGQNENGVIEFRLINNKVASFSVTIFQGC